MATFNDLMLKVQQLAPTTLTPVEDVIKNDPDMFEGLCTMLVATSCVGTHGTSINRLGVGNANLGATKEMDAPNISTWLHTVPIKAQGYSDVTWMSDGVTFISSVKSQERALLIDEYDLSKLHTLKAEHSVYRNARSVVFVRCTRAAFVERMRTSRNDHMHKDVQVIDIDDLNRGCMLLRNFLQGHTPEDALRQILQCQRKPIAYRFHQVLLLKTMLERWSSKRIVLDACMRTGKTYIICAYIAEAISRGLLRVLWLTSVPSETFDQYDSVIKVSPDFAPDRVQCVRLDKVDRTQPLAVDDNLALVVVMSKQSGDRNPPCLKGLTFDLIIFDENHYAGTTDLARSFIEQHSHNATKEVLVSGTVRKIIERLGIHLEDVISWTYEQMMLCKSLDAQTLTTMRALYGAKAVDEALPFYKKEDYDIFPKLVLFSTFHNQERMARLLVEYGSTGDVCADVEKYFLVTNRGFNDIAKVKSLLKLILGAQPLSVLNRVHDHAQRTGSEVKNQLWFLPVGAKGRWVDLMLPALKKLIEDLYGDRFVVGSFDATMPAGETLTTYADRLNREAEASDRTCIFLTGRKASLGVSLSHVDVVINMSTGTNVDVLLQQYYRCMTERMGKTHGYIVDFNPHRLFTTVLRDMPTHTHGTRSVTRQLEYYTTTHHVANLFETELVTNSILGTITPDALLPTNELRRAAYIRGIICHNSEFAFTDAEVAELTSVVDVVYKPDTKTSTVKKDDHATLPRGHLTAHDPNPEDDPEDNPEDNPVVTSKDATVREHVLIPFLRFVALFSNDLREEGDLSACLDHILGNESTRRSFGDHCTTTWSLKNLEVFLQVITRACARFTSLYFTKDIILSIKRGMEECTDKKELLEFLQEQLTPSQHEKKTYGEVFTPLTLCNQMLDALPARVWSDPTLRWFDPAAGIGNFPVCVYYRLIDGLKDAIPDEGARHEHVLTNMLYMAELNAKNVFVLREIFDGCPHIYEGNTLTMDTLAAWGQKGFDIVIGNPPYNDGSGNKGKGHTLWTTFVERALDTWLAPEGYLCFVHPSLWRQVDHPLGKTMKQYQILHLDIHDERDGNLTFKCNTRYDWYILQKTHPTHPTTIKDQEGGTTEVDISAWRFIPNCMYDVVQRLVGHPTQCIVSSKSAYETRKKWMSKQQTDVNIHPIVYSLPKTNIPSLLWSSKNDRGHFGVPKVIYGGGVGILMDPTGMYGLAEWCSGIVAPPEDHDAIVGMLKSETFKALTQALSVSKSELNTKALQLFRERFWEYL